ncbi:MAG: LytTR family DNA-binding domain-containing protein [Bacteroidota bacterium]|nr:response regulator transcription factor [Flavisolibacter sp.]MDQ3847155.1 LytTR family DNA-binding domain-containing protein [Bacteroidota bacterium]MBD0294993.1 response regulator transcription factor [Flavisolibacter sp.]MBD0350952.1 response regulator transcription factor [Flavisolibacter sp.]MBD0367439.1 response regulator transcription factor [Flavisolibacter sp.]
MLNAIIVDDEPYCCEVLSTLLERYCPEVEVMAVCSSAEEALKAIRHLQPQLVFLDIEMPQMNGFEMLERLPEVNFHLVFTTSYDQYAIKAIRFSAIDYLLKPIDREELQKAVQKVSRQMQKPVVQQLEILLQKINQSAAVNKVALPTMEGLQMVTVDNILHCESDSNYTVIFLKDKQKLVVSRTLKEIEEMLEDYPFARVHHSYLVNLNEINRYVKGEGGYLVMSDGTTIDVSRSKKEALLKKLLHNKE